MKKLNLALILCGAIFLVVACKKSSNSPNTPAGPASSTEWTFNKTNYMGSPGQWFFDTTGQALYLSTSDTSGADGLTVVFPEPNASSRPNPGKYYFVDMDASNIPSGVPLNQICIMEVGPSSNPSFSLGGGAADTATVSRDESGKVVVYFNNVSVTGGTTASGTLIE